jgi:hypothetical protein
LGELLSDHDPEGETGVDGLWLDALGGGDPSLGQRAEPVSRAKAIPSSIVSKVAPVE